MAQAKSSLLSFENFNSGAIEFNAPDLEYEFDYPPKNDLYLNQKDSNKIPVNDNSDSGCSINSDSDSSNSSGSPKEDIDKFNFNFTIPITQNSCSLELNGSYDFRNTTDLTKNNIKSVVNNYCVNESPSLLTSTVLSSTDNLDQGNSSLFPIDLLEPQSVDDFSNVLTGDVHCSKNFVVSQSQINGEKEFDNEEEISLSKFINDLEIKDNMVVSCKTHTDRLEPGHNLNFNKNVPSTENLNDGCDLTDFYLSVSIHNTDKLYSNASISKENNSFTFTESFPSINTDDCLSDLLSSINFEDNIQSTDTEYSEKFAFTLESKNLYSNDSKSCENDDESLAALAVKHLSTSEAHFYSENIEKKLEINYFEANDVTDILSVIDSEKVNFINSSSKTSTPSSSCAFQSSYEVENYDEDIDLTFCLKTEKTPDLPLKIETLLENDITICSEIVDLQDIAYPNTPSIPNCIKVIEVPTIKKINKRESLFSKALSCKPKTKQAAYLKVLNLKNDIRDQFFNLSNSVEPKKFIKEFVQLSNESPVVSLGRRTFV